MTAEAAAPFFFSPEAETLDRAALRRLQLERLTETLGRVYDRVPHYRRRFDEAGVRPEDLRSLEDLARFPFTVKTDLRDAYPLGMLAVPREELIRLHASSGTTGKPTVVGYTKGDLDRWSDLMARALATTGARPGDLVHNAYGYGLFTGGLGFHYGAERLGCTVMPASGGNTERQIGLIRDFGPRVLAATPSYALTLADHAVRNGIDLADSPLAIGVFGGEPWSEAMRGALDRGLGMRACDSYGLSEIMGPGVAIECHLRQGMHGWEDHFLFEVIDPQTLQPLPFGSAGELVITTLTKDALPMVRYRTRDMTVLTDEPCACGRTHLRIQRVSGRNDDMMIVRGVNVYPSQIEAVLLTLPGVAPHYQLSLTRQGWLDHLTVEAESLSPRSEEERSRLAQQVRHQIKSMVGVTCEVLIRMPGHLPRSEGKAVRVRDLRQEGA
jgi:phenylacetate-CoA ligase